MNDADESGALSLSNNDDLPGRLWAFDEFSTGEERSAGDPATGLVGLGFIRAALRRSRKVWLILGAVGLLAGLGVFMSRPPAFQASASVLLQNNPSVQPSDAMLDNQAIAQSRAVAALALKKLGLHESAGDFTRNYTVTALTSRVLLFAVKAPSSSQAVREANALASAFLTFQTSQLQSQERLVDASLQQQISQAQKSLDTLNTQISQVSAQPATPVQRVRLSRLQTQRTQAFNALNVQRQYFASNQMIIKNTTASIVQGSHVLDAALPIAQSRLRLTVIYAVTGLIMGLAIGMGIVVVRALVSDRLRRRDDVARALGAPVKLSVGKIRLNRRLAERGLEADQGADIRRIVTHLERAVPPSSSGLVALAIVAVDDPQVAAFSLVSLALSYAQQGQRVVLADLWSGSPAARLLGATEPGIHMVSTEDAYIAVTVPEGEDVAPIGPLDRGSLREQVAKPLTAACESADLLLTLAPLDPSVGGDYLAGWARSAIAVVTAGRSSAAKIHAVGEMIRLSGTELISGVLVGADHTDESLGVAFAPATVAQVYPNLDRKRS